LPQKEKEQQEQKEEEQGDAKIRRKELQKVAQNRPVSAAESRKWRNSCAKNPIMTTCQIFSGF